MTKELDSDITARMVRGLDEISVPESHLRVPTRGATSWAPLALAAVAIMVLVALGVLARQPVSDVATASPAVTPKSDRTTAPRSSLPVDPATLRVRYIMFGSSTLVVQPEAPDFSHTTVVEVRLLDEVGRLISAARVRPAASGEPRTCGHPALNPADLALLEGVAADTVARLRAGNWHLEAAQQDGQWNPIVAIDWRVLPESPCVE
jgi:hypothetical protein